MSRGFFLLFIFQERKEKCEKKNLYFVIIKNSCGRNKKKKTTDRQIGFFIYFTGKIENKEI